MAAYPFVPAPDHWPRSTSVRAIAIHMAEGGGTVRWLQRLDGNSSHYVVEYTGRVVQMVLESRAAGSINPKLLRQTDDAPFAYMGELVTYGFTAARSVLRDAWQNPNSAVIAIEIEGYARDGPNPVQRKALRSLVADIRSRYPRLPALGHRDFQDYKACPGKLVPWDDYGGHAKYEGQNMAGLAVELTGPAYGTVTVRDIDGVQAVQIADRERFNLAPGTEKPCFGRGRMLSPDFFPGRDVFIIGGEAAVVLADQVDLQLAVIE